MSNIILLTDSYKVSHWRQYPPGTTNVYSYYESRGGKFSHTLFFGLQYIIQKYLTTPITGDDIVEARGLCNQHFARPDLFNEEGWIRILEKFGGRLPVRIRAIPEGTRVPVSNVLMTVENTDPESYWLTNYLETLLAEVWYPTTVATLSNETRRMILGYLEATGDPAGIDYKLHDFGFRGVSSVESAGLGGAAHLVNFKGTDTLAALTTMRDHYDAEEAAGHSVPAAEHSTITSWGRHGEVDAFRNMILEYGDYAGPYSVVSDSYDIYRATRDYWGGKLRDLVLNANGTLVVRPDSGDPHVVVTRLLDILDERFGSERNEKGYRVLNPKVRIIQGDGMSYETIEQTLGAMDNRGWSADNVVFGMGGGLLQNLNRDTQRFAFKCSSVVIGGETRDVFKDPVGDHGKKSKRGRLALIRDENGEYTTVAEKEADGADELVTVYENGELVTRYTLDDIRINAGTAVPVAV